MAFTSLKHQRMRITSALLIGFKGDTPNIYLIEFYGVIKVLIKVIFSPAFEEKMIFFWIINLTTFIIAILCFEIFSKSVLT